jgi:hypothetical protein
MVASSFAEKLDCQGCSEAENEVSLDNPILEHIMGQQRGKEQQTNKNRRSP